MAAIKDVLPDVGYLRVRAHERRLSLGPGTAGVKGNADPPPRVCSAPNSNRRPELSMARAEPQLALSSSLAPDPEKVRLWSARAPAYERLCRRWQIFTAPSDRLIDLLPAELAGAVLDIGAGSGLTAELRLARRPRCDIMLVDPSEGMLEIATRCDSSPHPGSSDAGAESQDATRAHRGNAPARLRAARRASR
jgi:hypothetical protein